MFYNEIDDIQRELNQGDPTFVVLQATFNAGDVTIKGVEFDIGLSSATNIVQNLICFLVHLMLILGNACNMVNLLKNRYFLKLTFRKPRSTLRYFDFNRIC